MAYTRRAPRRSTGYRTASRRIARRPTRAARRPARVSRGRSSTSRRSPVARQQTVRIVLEQPTAQNVVTPGQANQLLGLKMTQPRKSRF